MTAIWIVSVLFGLVFTALLSGAALGRLLERIYRRRLLVRATRALKGSSRDALLTQVSAELDQVRQERVDVDAELERARTGRLIVRRQDLFGRICQLEAWRDAIQSAPEA